MLSANCGLYPRRLKWNIGEEAEEVGVAVPATLAQLRLDCGMVLALNIAE